MSIRTIMCVFGVDHWDQDLRTAIEFCETKRAHLTALVVSMFSVPPVAVYPVTESWLDEQDRHVEELSEGANAMREILAQTELTFDVQEIYAGFEWADHEIARHALYADLILVGAQAAGNPDLQQRVINGALFQSPTPILLNPSPKAVTAFPKSVVLAWDSSGEAARAAQQSMEFLKGCDCVHVSIVDPVARRCANGEEPGSDIATFLSRHGVRVEVEPIPSGGHRIDETLLQHAADVAADVIVMGAYRHSRLRERLFGGITRSMLKNSSVPLFLSR